MSIYGDNQIECRLSDEIAVEAVKAMSALSGTPKNAVPINEFFAARGVSLKVECPAEVRIHVEQVDTRTFRYSVADEDAYVVLKLCATLQNGFAEVGIEHFYEFSDQDAGCVFYTRNSCDERTNYVPGEGGGHDQIIYDAMGSSERWATLNACIGAIDLLTGESPS